MTSHFSPAAVKAFETPSAERTPAQADLAAPVDKAYLQIKVEDNLTAAERPRYDNLIQRLAKAVLEFPEKDDSHKVRYDGFFDVPSATVLRDFPVEMVPDTYVYGRGDMSRPLTKANPGLPGALLDNQDPSDLAMGPGGPRFREQFALWLTKPDHPLEVRNAVALTVWARAPVFLQRFPTTIARRRGLQGRQVDAAFLTQRHIAFAGCITHGAGAGEAEFEDGTGQRAEKHVTTITTDR